MKETIGACLALLALAIITIALVLNPWNASHHRTAFERYRMRAAALRQEDLGQSKKFYLAALREAELGLTARDQAEVLLDLGEVEDDRVAAYAHFARALSILKDGAKQSQASTDQILEVKALLGLGLEDDDITRSSDRYRSAINLCDAIAASAGQAYKDTLDAERLQGYWGLAHNCSLKCRDFAMLQKAYETSIQETDTRLSINELKRQIARDYISALATEGHYDLADVVSSKWDLLLHSREHNSWYDWDLWKQPMPTITGTQLGNAQAQYANACATMRNDVALNPEHIIDAVRGCLRLRKFSEALDYLVQGMHVVKTTSDDESESAFLDYEGVVQFNLGNYADAQRDLEWALQTSRPANGLLGDRTIEIICHLGQLYTKIGQGAKAEQLYQAPLKLIKGTTDAERVQFWLLHYMLADTYAAKHDYKRAINSARESLKYVQDTGDPAESRFILVYALIGEYSFRAGALPDARTAFAEASQRFHHSVYGGTAAGGEPAMYKWGKEYLQKRDCALARQLFDWTLIDLNKEKKTETKQIVRVLTGLGDSYACEHQFPQAVAQYDRALRLSQSPSDCNKILTSLAKARKGEYTPASETDH